MNRFSMSSLRTRLMLLFLLAIVPALGLLFYATQEQRRSTSLQVQQNARLLAQLVSANQHDLIEGARHLLTILAKVPVVQDGHPGACDSFLQDLLKEYPLYENFGVVDSNGDLICSAIPANGPVSAADRAWFHRAVQRNDFAVGEYQIGRVTGEASINFGYPIPGRGKKIAGVVFAALNLAWFNELAAKSDLPPGTTVTVLDRRWTVLTSYPHSGKWVGHRIPNTSLLNAITAQNGEGTAETTGLDGVPRLYGFTSLEDKTVGVTVVVGIPSDLAFASANRILAHGLALLLLVSLLTLIGTWWGGDWLIVRKINGLIKVTERLAAGDVRARVGSTDNKGELHQLACAFDHMADSLEKQKRDLQRANHQIQRNLESVRALREIDLAITSSLDLHSVLNVLLEKIDLFLPYAVATIRLVNKETGYLEPVACRNLNEEEWKAETASPADLRRVLPQDNAPLMVLNAQTDPRSLSSKFLRKHNLVSFLRVPLTAKGETLGVLTFFTREEHVFSKDEVEFLTLLAGRAAVAIHNARLYEQIKNQALELEKANKVKDEFLGLVSHELKTPVNVVKGYASLLHDKTFGEINAEQKRALEKMMNNSSDLLHMINTLLAATKLKADAAQLEIEEVNLNALFEELKSAYDVTLGKELSLVWDYPYDLPVVKTDGDKLKHVLQNLINNAIKYTDRGSVTVSTRHLPKSKSVEFKITDTGIGISDEALPSIFDMFRQVSGSEARSDRGVGLGLYIVKKFVELLGGEVKVESRLGKGSMFTMTMPTRNEVDDLNVRFSDESDASFQRS